MPKEILSLEQFRQSLRAGRCDFEGVTIKPEPNEEYDPDKGLELTGADVEEKNLRFVGCDFQCSLVIKGNLGSLHAEVTDFDSELELVGNVQNDVTLIQVSATNCIYFHDARIGGKCHLFLLTPGVWFDKILSGQS